jgi:hypothetical protein
MNTVAPFYAFASERLLIKLLLRNPERLAMARASLQGARLQDPRYRAIYEALLAGCSPEALPQALSGPAAAALGPLQREAGEIDDVVGTFASVVADIRIPGLFDQLQRLGGQMEAKEPDAALLRQWQELHAELRRLGAEGRLGPTTSRRYRGALRTTLEESATTTIPEGTMRTGIYVQGEDVSVVTDAKDERDFEEGFTAAFTDLVAKGNGNGKAVRRAAMRAAFDIVAKLRGYKSEVQERRVLAAGRWPHPSEQPLADANDDVPETEA